MSTTKKRKLDESDILCKREWFKSNPVSGCVISENGKTLLKYNKFTW